MNFWPLPAGTTNAAPGTRRPAVAALAAMVGRIGEPSFAATALQGLNEAQLQAASWAVYQLWPGRAPVLHLSSSVGVADTTRQCFAAYLDGLYRRDRSFDAVPPGHAAVLRMHADEAPTRDHRDAIYRRHGVLERLSVVKRADDHSLLAINLYHHQHQGPFGEGEVAGFAEVAPLLLAAVQRHIDLSASAAIAAADALAHAAQRGRRVEADSAAGSAPAPLASVAATTAAISTTAANPTRAALSRRCPTLTARELDVCERLLRGWSYDGIAADLGLSLATVKTYRARAFERLGMHFKSQLFAAFVPRA